MKHVCVVVQDIRLILSRGGGGESRGEVCRQGKGTVNDGEIDGREYIAQTLLPR